MKSNMSLVLGPEVDRVGLQGVVEFASTGAVASLNRDTLVQIQAAAHTLGVPRVLDLCTEEEERRKREGEGKKESKVSAAEQMRMSLQSIRVLWEERLGCDVILEVEGMSFDVHRVVMAASSDYFRGMFTSGMRESQQPRVTLPFLVASELEALIGCNSLCVSSEVIVYKAAIAWIEADRKKRRAFAKKLLPVPLAEHRTYLPKDAIVLVGGDQISEDLSGRILSRQIWFGNSIRNRVGLLKEVEWRRLGEIPKPSRFSHQVVVLEEKLYVVGGRSYYGVYDILNSAYRYDPLKNSWQRLADLQDKRCRFSMTTMNGVIYAIGGNHDSYTNIDSVECYSPKNNSWSYSKPLDQTLSSHAVVYLNGEILISGGFNCQKQCLVSLFTYQPAKGTTYRADMNRPRANHCMESLNGRLYVAGGVTVDTNMVYVDQLAFEMYNPEMDCWNILAPLPKPQAGAASALLEGKLYVLGGLGQGERETRKIHRYDPANQHWEDMGGMPDGTTSDSRACLLSRPLCCKQ
ncbi:kelch-like protein 33 [Aplochiton taeniatus]